MKLIGKYYKIKLTLQGGQKEEYNMPYINSEPSKDEIIGFIDNFRPSLKGKVVSVDWEYWRDMTDREM
jgi:hypothetical protein